MPDPSIGPVTTTAPPLMCEEPVSTNPAGSQTPVCVCPPVESSEGSGASGAQVLVERFGGYQGAGGTGEVPEEPETPRASGSCDDDAARAVASCGQAVRYASAGGVGAILGAIGCAGALGGYLECLATERRGDKP